MSNELQRFTYERKKPGDPIRSRDWNAAMQAITDLGNALRSNPNGIPTGPLSVQGFLNVQGTVSATRFVGDGSGLTGIQSSGGSQWSNGTNGAIHYTGGNVGIGTPYANEKLEVQGTVKATRFVGDGSGLTGIQGAGGLSQGLDTPAAPQRVGQWVADQRSVNAVTVAGKYAYLAVDNVGLCILDISDPAKPQSIGEGGYASLYTQGVAIAGNYAYLATTMMGVDVFALANAAIPQQVGAVNVQATTQAIYISGYYGYLATSDRGLQIIDIANPATPQLVGSGAAVGSARGLTVAGQYAYIATADQGLQIVDIADPANPQRIGQGVSTIGSAQGVYVSGQYAFVATSDQGLQIIDISDPANPLRVGAGLPTVGSALDVYVAGRYAYVAASERGLQIVDVADTANPQLVGVGVGSIGSAQAVYVAGQYAYVAAGTAGLQIVDLQGAAIFAATIGAVATNAINVAENAVVGNDLSVRGGLNIGAAGIKSDGPVQAKEIRVTGTLTATRFEGDGSGLTGIQGAGGSGPWAANADNTGIVYKAGLNVTIGAANSGTSLQVLNKNQEATGDTLVLGRSDGSHLRLGYHANYSWIQSSTGKPLLLNPLENNVGIGNTNPTSALHVGVGRSVRHELGPSQKLSLGGNGAFEIDAPNIVGGRFVVSEGGNVGIGVPQPGEKLEVAGIVKATKFVGDGSALTGVQGAALTRIDGKTTLEFGAGLSGKQVDAGKIGYQTFTADALDIVGAGTTDTNRKIKLWAEGGAILAGDLAASGTVTASKFVGDGSGLTGLSTGAASQWTSGANGVIHYAGGNVGIGTTGPTSALHVAVGKSVRHELGPNQKLSLGGNGTFEVDAPNIVGGRLIVAEGGSVGIGVPGPKEKLEVNGTVKATRFVGDGSGLTGVPSTSPTKVDGRTALEFGAGISGKQVDAGKIGYQTFTGDALDIVGAGTTATNRKIKLWAEGGITITGKITTPAFDDLSTAVQQLRNDLDALNDAFRRHIHLYAGLPTTGPG